MEVCSARLSIPLQAILIVSVYFNCPSRIFRDISKEAADHAIAPVARLSSSESSSLNRQVEVNAEASDMDSEACRVPQQGNLVDLCQEGDTEEFDFQTWIGEKVQAEGRKVRTEKLINIPESLIHRLGRSSRA